MALSQTAAFQLRLISCHILGILVAFTAMPHLLAFGLRMRHVVLASVLGAILFLAIATLAGLAWSRSIRSSPIQWAVAAPIVVPVAIYFLLRLPAGSGPYDAEIALESSLVGGLCSLLSSAIFLVWASLSSKEIAER